MSTFTLTAVDRIHVELACTCGRLHKQFLAGDRRGIERAKRDHLCRGNVRELVARATTSTVGGDAA